jgi:hypothetical protein
VSFFECCEAFVLKTAEESIAKRNLNSRNTAVFSGRTTSDRESLGIYTEWKIFQYKNWYSQTQKQHLKRFQTKN